MNEATAPKDSKVRQVELMISNLLRIGVRVSLTLIILGTVMSFIHHPEYLYRRRPLERLTTPGGAAVPHTLHDVWEGINGLRGQAIVAFGLLLLIATPVVRVGISILGFIYERDLAYTAVTSLVLLLLILSFVLGRAEQ
jgi:uncharacterized membrane protein